MIELKTSYKTSEARALYLVAIKSYGSLYALSKELGFTRQYFTDIFKNGLPLKYAGYLGRRHELCPAVLCFEVDALMCAGPMLSYKDLIDTQPYFTEEEKKYILAGTHIKDVGKFIKLKDKEIGCGEH